MPCGRLDPAMRDWLLDTGSLTQRLIEACPGRFRVEVIGQHYGRPHRNEYRILHMRHAQRALIRQVRLYCDDQPWVFARTVIPQKTLSGRRRRLARLGSKPLGAVLFADKSMRRDEMQISCIRAGQALFDVATRGLRPSPGSIWGRRSVFYLDGAPLLVSEVFLPGLDSCIE
jgi:chorismate--pyruvate lyase